MKDGQLHQIENKAMMDALHHEHTHSDMFVAYLLGRNIRYEEDLVDQLFNSSEKRLARVLLMLAHFGKEAVPEPVVPKIRQETLAEIVPSENLFNSDQTIPPACANKMTMGIRQCLGCGGELVMAFRPSEIGRLIPGTEKVAKSTPTWRCSTCGQAFTSDQLRAGKRAALRPVEQT